MFLVQNFNIYKSKTGQSTGHEIKNMAMWDKNYDSASEQR